MPFLSRLFERVERADGTFSARTSDGKFHRQNRDAHDDEEKQIHEYKGAASVKSGDIRKLPYVSDSDRTSGREEDKSEP